jgi:hypothetical protein
LAGTLKETPMSRLSIALGLLALALVLAVVGMAIAAIKWLLVIVAVLFLLGALRAFVAARDETDDR